ncbi:MAG TPA: hypothetical protein PK360_21605 [bacterium]|nr:hypothetical protein [bacterium]
MEKFVWSPPRGYVTEEILLSAAIRACREYHPKVPTVCSAVFYPYTELKSTLRMKKEAVHIRVSDILRGAPEEVLQALILVLIARALRRKPSQEALRIYNEYIHRPQVEACHAKARKKRRRKLLTDPKGKYHDLNESFKRINRRYFAGNLEKPILSWSPTASRRQLGYHDAHLNVIVISRWLDRKTVPPFFVDFIMYHELLHIVVPAEFRNGKRIVHTREFKALEKHFELYDDAMVWLHRIR